MSVSKAIADAEVVLPGSVAPEGALDPRWQAIIEVANYVESDPDPIWAFSVRWGSHPDADLRTAIATCLLEHLLEHHFESVFPKVELAVRSDPRFADCFSRCWAYGQATAPWNQTRFDALKEYAGRSSVRCT